MNSTRERVISLLGQGFSQAVVANTLGVQPSWVSQLLDDPDVRQQVQAARTNQLQERVEDDKTLEKMERRALKLLDDKMAFVRSPKEAASIFLALNKANRKTGSMAPETDAVALQQVNITLPKAAASIHIKLNQNNQVIEVEGRSMATLPSRALPSLASSKQAAIEAAPVPTIFEIQQATQKRLQHEDTTRADAALDMLPAIKDIEVMLDGVPCVL